MGNFSSHGKTDNIRVTCYLSISTQLDYFNSGCILAISSFKRRLGLLALHDAENQNAATTATTITTTATTITPTATTITTKPRMMTPTATTMKTKATTMKTKATTMTPSSPPKTTTTTSSTQNTAAVSSSPTSSTSQAQAAESERTGLSDVTTRDVTDKYVSQTQAGGGLSSGTVAGVVVALTGMTVIILLIAFIIRFRKNGKKRKMRDPAATHGAHLATYDTTCRHEDNHHPDIDEHAYTSIKTATSNEENPVYDTPTASDIPTASDTPTASDIPTVSDGYVTCHKDSLQQQEDKGIYSELENYADWGFSNNNTDIYNRLLLNASSRGRDSPAGSDAVNYDHLSLAGQVPTQSHPQLSDDSNADDYSHICRQGEGGLDLRSASTVEDTYHHLQSDDPDEYNRLRRQGDEDDKHSACPVTDNYSHLQLPVHTIRTHACNNYELAKVIS